MKKTSLIAAILLGFLTHSVHAQTSEWQYTDGTAYVPKTGMIIIEVSEDTISAKAETAASDIIPLNHSDDRIHVYPNPSHAVFYINGVKAGYMIEVDDQSGKKVYKSEINRDKYPVDLSVYGKGFYTYHITDAGNPVQQGKMVVE